MSASSLDDLLAVGAITDVVHRYCRAVDRMDRELALSCWHEGGTADYGSAFEGTATGLVDWLWETHEKRFHAHSHQVANVLVEVRGDRAVSESYATVTLRAGEPPDGLVDIVGRGRYLDRWSKRSGVWAIDHRQQVNDLRSVYPAGAALAELASNSRRDRTDPSFELFG